MERLTPTWLGNHSLIDAGGMLETKNSDLVDQYALQAAGFRRVQPKDTGRPGYDPADLLKLYL